jgi:translin
MRKKKNNLEQIAEDIRQELSATDASREKILPLCRESIRHSAESIRAMHRHEYDKAQESLNTVRTLLTEARQVVTECEELYYTGYMSDAQKEYSEASVLLALITEKPLPSHTDLQVSAAAYLNGIGETVGELRRYLLDAMRKGDTSSGESILNKMDDIYNILVTMDFPDALTHGLRRTTDLVRGILEKTRGDLTLAIREDYLQKKLEILERGG